MHILLKSSAIDFCELQIRPAVRKALNKAKNGGFPWCDAMVDLHLSCNYLAYFYQQDLIEVCLVLYGHKLA